MLPVTLHFFKIFINVFTSLYIKANSKEIREEISFPSSFRKNADVSIFAEILEKMPVYAQFSLWIPTATTKFFFFRVVAQKPLHLADTEIKEHQLTRTLTQHVKKS